VGTLLILDERSERDESLTTNGVAGTDKKRGRGEEGKNRRDENVSTVNRKPGGWRNVKGK